jgi:hypothetical protein
MRGRGRESLSEDVIMLHRFRDLKNCELAASDGEIGKIKELCFSDQRWVVRNVVVDTGGWLLGRKVLIPPHSLGLIETDKKLIAVHLTREQIENSPLLDADKPPSRQYEEEWNRYYGSALYWVPEATGVGAMVPPIAPVVEAPPPRRSRGDPHLRSTSEVLDYAIHATDGDIGRVEDFIVDDESWHIRYLVILRSWWAGTEVLLSPAWVDLVSWDEMKVFIGLSRETIKSAPVWDGSETLARSYEESLYSHYGKERYWPPDMP